MGCRSSSQGCGATGNQGASCSPQPRPLGLPLNPLECGRLVCELKAEREEQGEHTLNERFAVAQQLKIGRFVLKIDGDGPVFACSFGCLSHVSPPGYQVSVA